MIALIVVGTFVIIGVVALAHAIKNAPVIEEHEDRFFD